MADDNGKPLITGYRLVIQIAGPGFSDKTAIEAEDPVELVAKTRTDEHGYQWERYGDEADYVEFRSDFVWARSFNTVEDKDIEVVDPEADPEAAGGFRPPEASDIRRLAAGGERPGESHGG